jgi:hypothetical protein
VWWRVLERREPGRLGDVLGQRLVEDQAPGQARDEVLVLGHEGRIADGSLHASP